MLRCFSSSLFVVVVFSSVCAVLAGADTIRRLPPVSEADAIQEVVVSLGTTSGKIRRLPEVTAADNASVVVAAEPPIRRLPPVLDEGLSPIRTVAATATKQATAQTTSVH
jgi:hypothetical protein